MKINFKAGASNGKTCLNLKYIPFNAKSINCAIVWFKRLYKQ